MSARLDHGILNVPLSKRGDIDRDIDRWKAEQEKIARREDRERITRARARKARIAEILSDEAFLAAKAANLGITIAKVRDSIRSMTPPHQEHLIRLYARDTAGGPNGQKPAAE